MYIQCLLWISHPWQWHGPPLIKEQSLISFEDYHHKRSTKPTTNRKKKQTATTYLLPQVCDAGLYMSTSSNLDLKNLYCETMLSICHSKDDQVLYGNGLVWDLKCIKLYRFLINVEKQCELEQFLLRLVFKPLLSSFHHHLSVFE